MSKRFTESEKWRDAWFRKLPAEAKLLWLYLLDTCDAAGVVELDLELASFQIGMELSMQTLLDLQGRVDRLECGKFWIPRFIAYQVGRPSRDCRAHNPIFLSIEKHHLERVLEGYPIPSDKVQDKDKDKEKDKDRDKDWKGGAGGKPPPTEVEVLAYAENGSTVPITKDCALRWLTDRETAEWTRPKGLHMLPVLPNWQSDLRGYALDWNKRESEKRSNGNGRKPAQPSRIPHDPTKAF